MSIIKEFNENRKDQLIVLNIPKKQVFIIKQNKSFYIFAQDTISENGYIYNKFLKPIIKQSTYKITFPKNVPGTNQPQNKLIKTAHRTIITLNNNLMINKWDIKKNNILIISKNILPPRNILNSLKENDIILDSSCTQEQQIIWRKFCEENKIICYFTTKQATIINL